MIIIDGAEFIASGKEAIEQDMEEVEVVLIDESSGIGVELGSCLVLNSVGSVTAINGGPELACARCDHRQRTSSGHRQWTRSGHKQWTRCGHEKLSRSERKRWA